jgi:N6-L-threonylcarbamoyladenine synthase
MNAYVILGIETSCDDTSMAIVKDGKVLSVFSISSLKKFHKYGGIVPEIAARMHEEALFEVLEKNILEAKIKINDFTHIAYTSCPGMPGSLHVGKIFAKTLSFLFNIPLLPINHMLGHIFSFAINNKKIIKYPFISLVVSGGDTVIYKISNVDKYKILNATTDDSVGETLDKIGRVLSLEYPGGVSIDKNYNKKYANLKLIDHYPCEKNFSFSGIKTFILNMVNNLKLKKKLVDHIQIGSSVLK